MRNVFEKFPKLKLLAPFWPIISLDVKSSADEIKSSTDDIKSSADAITLGADDIKFSAYAITFVADDQRCSTDVRQTITSVFGFSNLSTRRMNQNRPKLCQPNARYRQTISSDSVCPISLQLGIP